MRQAEGQALADVLNGQLDTIERLTLQVEADPSRTPAEISEKLQSQIETLLGVSAKTGC